ncbi:hypothetical protein SBBP2_250036 [Burkholderiales bacterium]|nr:hypothetical protein SBBP2_250036 [Burkholderiales bacterium]
MLQAAQTDKTATPKTSARAQERLGPLTGSQAQTRVNIPNRDLGTELGKRAGQVGLDKSAHELDRVVRCGRGVLGLQRLGSAAAAQQKKEEAPSFHGRKGRRSRTAQSIKKARTCQAYRPIDIASRINNRQHRAKL